MSKSLKYVLLIFALAIAYSIVPSLVRDRVGGPEIDRIREEAIRKGRKAKRPSDWFFAQRAYPNGEVNLESYRTEVAKAIDLRKRGSRLRGVHVWVQVGPTNIGGRISALAVDPMDRDVIYAGAASGGVLKSTNGGQQWFPLFDNQPTLSIGSMAIDPQNPDILYVGTGEANAGGGSVTYGGFGVFKTTDGGLDWEIVGLENTRYIGKVIVDPVNTDRVYVAAVGTLFSTNPDRGVYRSTDAGASWEQVLFVSDSTGAIDIIQDPMNTDVLYVAMWERIRRPESRRYGGPTSGVYKTTDGGETWFELSGGLPAGSNVGRIGLTLSAADPSIVYAIYADATGYFDGVYRSTNSGISWTRVNDSVLESGYFYSSYGWWFGVIVADPTDPEVLYAHGITMYKSTSGGNGWFQIAGSNHVDHHAMVIDPVDPSWVIEGNDGGVYTSTNSGGSWDKCPDLPITQFYTGEIDYLSPERYYGGTQDNGTVRTWTGGVDDWEAIYGGDGFYVLVDPTNSNVIYAEYQYGGLAKSTNGGLTFNGATNGISPADRRNWSTPVAMDPSDPEILYYGTYRLYRTTNGASLWSAISGDLTDGPVGGNLVYNTITTIAISPIDPKIIYVGTDDGNVWVTFDGGGAWYDIGADLPERWVTRVAADPVDPLVAYVTLSGFRWDSPLPHVFVTEDGGATWTDISDDLLEVPVNDIIIDPSDTDYLYIGTDVGVFQTTDGGATWESLHEGFPIVPVTDLTFHAPTRTLSAATYGRSMFTVDLPPPLGIEGEREPRNAGNVSLAQNYPNPFNPLTSIRFDLADAGRIRLEIYDLRGRVVKKLVDREIHAGRHEVVWDGMDEQGRPVPGGPYIYKLDIGDEVITRKMLLVK
jgi:photosystem II stability/assembly factor-like uncharacterized protein